MRRMLTFPLVAALLVGGLTPFTVPVVAQTEAAATAPKFFSLDFAGGTLEDYLSAVRRAHGEANIAIIGTPAKVDVAPMELRNITLDAAVRLVHGRWISGESEARVDVSGLPMQGKSELAYRVEARFWDNTRQAELGSSVWSLAENINAGFNTDDLLGAVQVALTTFPEEATIRFHEPTSLLIVHGTKAQIALVSQTLQQLSGDAHRQVDRAQELRGQIDTIETLRSHAEIEARIAAKKHEVAQAQLRLQRATLDMEDVSDLYKHTVVAPLELQAMEAEGELQRATQQLEGYTNQLKDRRAQLEAALNEASEN